MNFRLSYLAAVTAHLTVLGAGAVVFFVWMQSGPEERPPGGADLAHEAEALAYDPALLGAPAAPDGEGQGARGEGQGARGEGQGARGKGQGAGLGEESEPQASSLKPQASTGAGAAPAAGDGPDAAASPFADPRQVALLRPLLDSGAISQVLALHGEGRKRPVRAVVLVRAPVALTYRVLARAQSWAKFLPKVVSSEVLSQEGNRMRVATEINVKNFQRTRVVEDWTLEENRSLVSVIQPGAYAGWNRFDLFPVAGGDAECLLVHSSMLEARNPLVKAIVESEEELETAFNQSVVTLRVEAFQRQSEALYQYLLRKRAAGSD